MTLNDLLGSMRHAGLVPIEEDFMDDYGLVAERDHRVLRNRHFRCMFARVRVEEICFEAYVFPAATDAEEFEQLMQSETEGWTRRDNLVLKALDGGVASLQRLLTRTLAP